MLVFGLIGLSGTSKIQHILQTLFGILLDVFTERGSLAWSSAVAGRIDEWQLAAHHWHVFLTLAPHFLFFGLLVGFCFRCCGVVRVSPFDRPRLVLVRLQLKKG